MEDVEVPLGTTMEDLFDQYSQFTLLECNFTVECKCGEWHTLEVDGYTTCSCGEKVQSPMLAAGMI